MRSNEDITEAAARDAECAVCESLRLHIERPRRKVGNLAVSACEITRGLLGINMFLLISFRLNLVKPYGKDLRDLESVDILRVSRSDTHVMAQGTVTWSTKSKNRRDLTERFLGRFRPEKKTIVAYELLVGEVSQRRCLATGRARTKPTTVSSLRRYMRRS